MRAWIVVVALVVAGCGSKDSSTTSSSPYPAPPASTSVQDTLWKLAPDKLVTGLVVSPRGLTALESAVHEVQKVFETTPDLAEFTANFKRELAKVWASGNLSFAAAGLDPQLGAALFVLPEDTAIFIVPVKDRDKFVAVAKGTKGTDSDTFADGITCKTVQGFYACSKPEALAKIGTKPLADAMKLAGARGEIELLVEEPTDKGLKIVAAVQIARGSFVTRGAIQIASEPLASLFVAGGKPTADLAKVAAFGVLNAAPLVVKGPPEPTEILEGVTDAALLEAIGGPVQVAVPAGSTTVDVRVPLKDPTVVKKLVEQCDQIPEAKLVGATVVQGRCKIAMPMLSLDAEIWIENNELRVRQNGGAGGGTLPPSSWAKELATGQWAVAFYGRGTLLADGKLPQVAAHSPDVKVGVRLLSQLNEGAFGVRTEGETLRFMFAGRTTWANPDAVVAKILAIQAPAIIDRSAVATGKSIAAEAPSSPFAADLKAGPAGALVPMLGFAGLAQLSVPILFSKKKEDAKGANPDVALLLDQLNLFREQMCECKDMQCTEKVNEAMTAWSVEQAKMGTSGPPKMTDEQMKVAVELGEKMNDCMQRALAAGSAAPPMSDADRYLAMNEDYKTKICACKDKACANGLLEELTKKSEDFIKQKGDSATMKNQDMGRMKQIEEEIRACGVKLK